MNRFRSAWSLRLSVFIFSVIASVHAQVTTWHSYVIADPGLGLNNPAPVLGTPFSASPPGTPPAWTGAFTSIPPNLGSPLGSAADGAGNVYTIYSNNPIPGPDPYQGFVSRTTSGVTSYFGLSFVPRVIAVTPGGDLFIMNDPGSLSGTNSVYELKPDGSTLLVGSFSGPPITNVVAMSVDSNDNVAVAAATVIGLPGRTPATFYFAAESPVPDLAAPLAPVSVAFSANPTVTLTGIAFSSLPITYQWSYNGTPIPGATAAIYVGTVSASGTYSVLATTTAGSVTSQAVVTLVVQAVPVSATPVFLTNPVSLTIPLGPSTTLTASAAATLPISFQWYVNGALIPGATQVLPSSTNLGAASTNYTTNQPGSYLAVATTTGLGGSSIMSVAAVVTVQAPGGISALPTPTITTQPQSVAFAYGRGATLSAASVATLPATYQWQLNGVDVPGANSATYQPNLLGSYDVVISTAAGSVTSASANVALANRPVNLSSRAFVGNGANLTIAGFVISSYSGATKRVLIRAAGPGLTPLGVSGALARPVLSVFDSNSQLVATNTGWNNSTDIAAASLATGAFPFAANSTDSALLLDLAPGNYTAQVSGLNGSTGIALVEVYELAADNGHFVNISTRAFVGSDAAILIGGLVVTGTQPSPVLIRAIGPGLARFNLPGFLTQPILSVYNNSTGQLIAVNIGWSNGSSADAVAEAAAATATGGFSLTPGSADSAVLLNLAPGVYTAQVTGANGTTGIALIEAYQVPQ